jgi:HD-like signal output (HDOD) protein
MTTPEAESHLRLLPEQGRAVVGRICKEIATSLVPMISQLLRVIKDLSNKPESLSVNDLVEFVSSEPTTMSRVISIANTLGFNTRGVEIVSVHHAVSIIGFNRVRTLAISILLLDGAQSKFTVEANRELAGAALISGLVAAEMCRLGAPADPELAFICGALRGYGRMLAATFLPAEYSEAVKLSAREGYERSFEMIFGLSSLELGREVLLEMKVPSPIMCTFEKIPPNFRGDSMNPAGALLAAADFGLRTSELLHAPDLTSDNFEPRLVALSNMYDFPVKLVRADVRQLLHHIVGVLECFRYQAGSYLNSVVIFKRIHCLAAENPLPPPYGMQFKAAPPAKAVAPETIEPPNYDI